MSRDPAAGAPPAVLSGAVRTAGAASGVLVGLARGLARGLGHDVSSNAARGMDEPSRTIACFVDRLVDDLVREVGIEQYPVCAVELLAALLGVGGEERGAVACGPLGRPVVPLLGLAAGVGATGHGDHARGVVEGADHARHVAPDRVGLEPLGERLGRLALEVDDLPALDGAQGLAEVQVAVDLLHLDGVELAQPGERLAQPALVGRQVGYDVERGDEPALHRPGQLAQGVGLAPLDREVLGQVGVHLGQRDAEPRGLAGEVAADLVGVQVGLGEQVAHAGQRQVPAVARGAEELLEHRELDGRVGVVVDEVEPPVERGDVRRPGLGEDLVDRDVGVDPRGHLAEDLHQRVLAERDRRVGLLAGEERRVGLDVEVVARQPVEHEVAAHVGRRRRRDAVPGERRQPQGHRLAVVQRVVDVRVPELVVVPLADERVGDPLLRLGVERQRQLVEVGGPVVVRHLGELDRDAQAVGGVGQLADAAHARQRPVAPLAAEPAGLADPAGQVVVHDPSTPAVVGSVSLSQRKP